MYAHPAPRHGIAPDPRGLDPEAYARLGRLGAALAEHERRARLFRTPREEREALLMPRPRSAEQSYATFGLLLGTLPSAAIFFRLLYALRESGKWVLLFAAMLAVCGLVGRWMGKRVGRIVGERPHPSRTRALLEPLFWGLVWALVTGACGGLLFFGLGALFGAVFAVMVALPCFLAFALLHRQLSRGGMIDARHLSPLAWGVAATAAALILSPQFLPY